MRISDWSSDVCSSDLRLGDGSKPWLTGFFAVALALFGSAGWAAGLDWPFWLDLAANRAQFAWQIADVDLDQPENCLAKLKSNRLAGWLLLTGIIARSPGTFGAYTPCCGRRRRP